MNFQFAACPLSWQLATGNREPTTSNRQNSRPRPAIQAIRVIRSTPAFRHVGVFCPRHCLLTPHPVRRTMEQRVGPNATAASVANGRQDNAHPAERGNDLRSIGIHSQTQIRIHKKYQGAVEEVPPIKR